MLPMPAGNSRIVSTEPASLSLTSPQSHGVRLNLPTTGSSQESSQFARFDFLHGTGVSWDDAIGVAQIQPLHWTSQAAIRQSCQQETKHTQMAALTSSELSSHPPRKAYQLIVREVFDQEIKAGSDKLPLELRQLSLVATLHEQTRNGGLSQYFTNCFGEDYKLALAALREIGAEHQEKLVLKWLGRLQVQVKPEDRIGVGTCLFENRTLLKELEAIDLEYFRSADSFYTAVVRYVFNNARVFGIG
jgi:hypothetical protein